MSVCLGNNQNMTQSLRKAQNMWVKAAHRISFRSTRRSDTTCDADGAQILLQQSFSIRRWSGPHTVCGVTIWIHAAKHDWPWVRSSCRGKCNKTCSCGLGSASEVDTENKETCWYSGYEESRGQVESLRSCFWYSCGEDGRKRCTAAFQNKFLLERSSQDKRGRSHAWIHGFHSQRLSQCIMCHRFLVCFCTVQRSRLTFVSRVKHFEPLQRRLMIKKSVCGQDCKQSWIEILHTWKCLRKWGLQHAHKAVSSVTQWPVKCTFKFKYWTLFHLLGSTWSGAADSERWSSWRPSGR